MPLWMSLLWELRDYIFAIDKFMTDPNYQRILYEQAMKIAPIIVKYPNEFMLSKLMLSPLLMFTEPLWNVASNFKITDSSIYVNIAGTYGIRWGAKFILVFVFSQICDLILMILAMQYNPGFELLKQLK